MVIPVMDYGFNMLLFQSMHYMVMLILYLDLPTFAPKLQANTGRSLFKYKFKGSSKAL